MPRYFCFVSILFFRLQQQQHKQQQNYRTSFCCWLFSLLRFFSLSFNEFIWFARSRSIFVFSIYLCLPYTIFHDVPRHILAISIIRFRFFLTLRLLVAVCFCWLTFRAACIAAYIYIHSLDDILHCDFWLTWICYSFALYRDTEIQLPAHKF